MSPCVRPRAPMPRSRESQARQRAEPPPRPAAVQRARRSTRLIIIGGALRLPGWPGDGVGLERHARSRTVVLMAKAVARGDLVESTDLTTTTIGRASGVAVVPAAENCPGWSGSSHEESICRPGSLVGPDSVGARWCRRYRPTSGFGLLRDDCRAGRYRPVLH